MCQCPLSSALASISACQYPYQIIIDPRAEGGLSVPISAGHCPYQNITDPLPLSLYVVVPIKTSLNLSECYCPYQNIIDPLSLNVIDPIRTSLTEKPMEDPLPLSRHAIDPIKRSLTLWPYVNMLLSLSEDHWPSAAVSVYHCPYQNTTDPLPRSLYTSAPIRTSLTHFHGLCIPVSPIRSQLTLSEHHWHEPGRTLCSYLCMPLSLPKAHWPRSLGRSLCPYRCLPFSLWEHH